MDSGKSRKAKSAWQKGVLNSVDGYYIFEKDSVKRLATVKFDNLLAYFIGSEVAFYNNGHDSKTLYLFYVPKSDLAYKYIRIGEMTPFAPEIEI